uniref:Uncharacterized protein n=1 Tax=Romanomermis culicivorax TaxID=13658 RepID=A0A915J950_ROMCU
MHDDIARLVNFVYHFYQSTSSMVGPPGRPPAAPFKGKKILDKGKDMRGRRGKVNFASLTIRSMSSLLKRPEIGKRSYKSSSLL